MDHIPQGLARGPVQALFKLVPERFITVLLLS